jgi:serine/threonine protein kinase
VTDFGLAKDSQASNLTRPGQALGSLDYMAPEQIRGEEVSAATDIYALGCMIHECLTGTPPYGGRPSMRVLFAHLQEEPPDLSELKRGDIAVAVAKAINKALEKEAEDRPASAAGYIASIARAAGL